MRSSSHERPGLGASASRVLALLVALALALPEPATAVGNEDAPGVVVRHAPLVYLHPAEDIPPFSADIYWERSIPPIKAPDETGGFYLDAPDGINANASIESAATHYEYEPGQYIVYWFFYAANDQGRVNVHEGDWEHVVIKLDSDDEPTHIAYYQHNCDPVILDWTDLDGHEPFGSWTGFWGETHPIVYSALGSHASYWGPRGRLDSIDAECWLPPDLITEDDLPAVLGDLPIDLSLDRIDDVLLGKLDDHVADLIEDRGDAAQKGGAWKTWAGPGLVDARSRPWYTYPGLWGEPNAELFSFDRDDAAAERLFWSTGGRGPGEERLRGENAVIPPGWGGRVGSVDSWPIQVGKSGSDWASSLDLDDAGNVYIAGQMGDQFLMKVDPHGSIAWTTHFGSADWGASPSVAVDGIGNAYVTLGDPSGFGKFSPDGDQVWTKKVGGSMGIGVTSLDVDDAGSLYILGSADKSFRGQTHFGGTDAFVQMRSAEGAVVWTRQFGTIHDEYNLAMAADGRGGVLAAGFRRDAEDNTPIGNYLVRFDGEGTQAWESWVQAFCGLITAVVADVAGNAYVAGYSNHHTGCLLEPPYAFLHKYAPDGSLIWTREFGPKKGAMGRAVAVDRSGNPYVVGSTSGRMSGQAKLGDGDAFVKTFTTDGSPRWTSQFGTAGHDRADAVGVDHAGNVHVAGSTSGDFGNASNAGESDAYVHRLTQVIFEEDS